jgi:acylaminoacyl-peptidase
MGDVMHKILAIGAFALFAVSCVEARPITQKDLATLDRITEPRISPDGKWVIYDLATTDYDANKRKHAIMRVAADGSGEPVKIADGTSARWAPDGMRIFYLGDVGGTAQVFSINPDARCIRAPCDVAAPLQVTNLPLEVGSYRISPNGKSLVVSMAVFPDKDDPAATKARLEDAAKRKATGTVYDRIFIRHWDAWSDGTQNHLFALKLGADGKATSPAPLMKGIDGDTPSKPFGDDGDYAVTPDSKSVVFAVRIAGKSEPWSTNFDVYEVPINGSKAPLNRTASNPAWDTPFIYSADGKSVAYRAMKRAGFEADRFAIMIGNANKAREAAPNWDRSADKIAWSGDGKAIYALAEDVGQARIFAVDVATGAAQALTGHGRVADFSVANVAGGDVIAYTRDGLDGPAQLHVVRPGQGEKQITHANAETLGAVELSPYEQFSFRGWNNETVYGYVMKPHGWKAGKKYPTVFLIHGGPQGSFGDAWSNRWNPNVWAGWGYGVVFVDFHGSTGYGQAFTDSISNHWGDRPLEDLQKGWAAAQAKYSWIDGSRACAAGASYGGYMVNWIAGKWKGPWKCLISHDGIFDNRMMGYATEELWFSEWENGRSTVWENPSNYETFNPVHHVKDWTKPMLIIHSANDFRIPIEQGIAVFTALQRKGVPSRFLTFPNENHWVLKPQNSVQWHDTVEAWLKQWIGDGAP